MVYCGYMNFYFCNTENKVCYYVPKDRRIIGRANKNHEIFMYNVSWRCTYIYNHIYINRGTQIDNVPFICRLTVTSYYGIGGVWHRGKSRPWKAVSARWLSVKYCSSYKFIHIQGWYAVKSMPVIMCTDLHYVHRKKFKTLTMLKPIYLHNI